MTVRDGHVRGTSSHHWLHVASVKASGRDLLLLRSLIGIDESRRIGGGSAAQKLREVANLLRLVPSCGGLDSNGVASTPVLLAL